MRTFEQAAEDYAACAQRYYDAARDLSSIKSELAAVAAMVASRESELIVDGAAVGSNDTVRKASLLVACGADEHWQRATRDMRSLQLNVAEAEAQRDDAANGMSLARREMDMAIATTELEAAVKAGFGLERANHHG